MNFVTSSVCPHGRIRQPLNRFYTNLLLAIPSETGKHNSIRLKSDNNNNNNSNNNDNDNDDNNNDDNNDDDNNNEYLHGDRALRAANNWIINL